MFVGDSFSDLALLSGGDNPTGTLTFTLYQGTACTQPLQVLQIPVNGNGTYSSGNFQSVSQAGTYQIVVSYSGDGFNAPSSTLCGDTNQQLQVTKFMPMITTRVCPRRVKCNECFRDTAILRGGSNLTGILRFELFPIERRSKCPLQISTIPVRGAGRYRSERFRIAHSGTYSIKVTYSGDDRNASVSTEFCDRLETIIVEPFWFLC